MARKTISETKKKLVADVIVSSWGLSLNDGGRDEVPMYRATSETPRAFFLAIHFLRRQRNATDDFRYWSSPSDQSTLRGPIRRYEAALVVVSGWFGWFNSVGSSTAASAGEWAAPCSIMPTTAAWSERTFSISSVCSASSVALMSEDSL
jgi:hypothetical protein